MDTRMIRSFSLAVVVLAASCSSGPFFSSNVLGGCSKDTDCSLGAVCDATRKMCVKATPPSVSAVVVTPSAQAGSNGFYTRAAGVNVPVDITVVEGTKGVGAAGVTLAINGHSYVQTTFTTVAGTTRTFHIDVPTTEAVNGGFEGSAPFTLDAADSVGNTLGPVPNPAWVLPIDDRGPVVANLQITTTPEAVVSSASWFSQSGSSGTDIGVSATVTDSGSGVNGTTLQLLTYNTVTGACTAPRIDHGTPTFNSGTGAATFLVQRSGGPITSGAEGLVNFCVAANDDVGNAQRTPVGFGAFGIDGKPPQFVSFTPNYPSANAGCDATVGSNMRAACGHDGSTFWKRGDQANTVGFAFSDAGSGVNTGKGKYNFSGLTCPTGPSTPPCAASPGTLSGNNQAFTFPADFSKAAFNGDYSATTGAGTVALTVFATDAVGNVSTNHNDTVNITRLKWIRTLSGVSNIQGAPIVTSQPVPQIIIAGSNNSGDPIYSVQPSGGTLWSFGSVPGITAVGSNMAYDSTNQSDVTHPTPVLYAVATLTAATSLFAMHVAPGSVDKYCSGSITTGFGAPALIGSGTAGVAIVGDSGSSPRELRAYQTNNLATNGACNQLDTARLPTAQTNALIGAPTASGSIVYWAYNNNASVSSDIGIASAGFNGSTFGLPAPNGNKLGTGILPSTNTLARSIATIADSLFFAYNSTRTYQAYTTGFVGASSWPTVALSSNANPTTPPIISLGTTVGVSTEPRVFGFDKTTASLNWSLTTTGTAFSQVTAGPDGTLYFTDDTSQLLAVVPSASSSSTAWTFSGTGGTAFVGPSSPPTVDGSGAVYFGTNAGKVFALLTDTNPSPPAASGADWPTLGHDNCNSNNATFSCQ